MSGTKVYAAKFNSNSAVVYMSDYLTGSDSIRTYEQENRDTDSMKTHSFGENAQKRMRSALDNLCSMFEAGDRFNFDLMNKINRKQGVKEIKVYNRKPVFLTLTVPGQFSKQGTIVHDDKYIKQKLLKPFLDNFSKHHGLKNWIWKAEAQERNDIHFHVICDCWMDLERVKKLWYKYLCDHDLQGEYLKQNGLDHASRVAWVNVIESIHTLKHELSGYFAAKRNDDGELLAKHNNINKQKLIREIEGNSWGCSDRLKYKAFTLDFIDYEFEEMLARECFTQKSITADDDKEKVFATVYVFRQYFSKKCKDTGRILNTYCKEKNLNGEVKNLYSAYHLHYAVKAYTDYEGLQNVNYPLYKKLADTKIKGLIFE